MFGKICVIAIIDNFFQYVVRIQGRGGVRNEGKVENSISWWGVTSNRRVRFKILDMSGENPPWWKS